MANTFWIEFIGDRSVKIEENQSVLNAALQAGIPHYHACGGNAQCSTCRILIKDGADKLTPRKDLEQALAKKVSLPENVRLACQTFVQGTPVKVHRIIRDEADMFLYTEEESNDDGHAMGQEKELALFFLDIRNFTPFMQTYLPFDVIHIMRRLFAIFKRAIDDQNGRIIETAGDGLYAVFGLKDADDNFCQKALDAAHVILHEVDQFNKSYLHIHFNHAFDIGIGIHTGKTIVGNIGLGINNNLTVMGLAVNIASRLQNATKELNNSIVVSDDFFQRLNRSGVSEKTKWIYLKGVREKFKVHLVGQDYEVH
ncbi:MAG TPA: adenylate/guanylate cyclase domain-containing protein [Chitinophagaceae bacterium]|jgi:adenylate cyclase|nr:adenylate/guanylate cyclase domain-containing protein [Chitinophagaceae bacterium]